MTFQPDNKKVKNDKRVAWMLLEACKLLQKLANYYVQETLVVLSLQYSLESNTGKEYVSKSTLSL
jgi:hypothetical protein